MTKLKQNYYLHLLTYYKYIKISGKNFLWVGTTFQKTPLPPMKKSKFLGKFHTSNCGRVYDFLSEGKRGRGVTEGGVVEGVPRILLFSQDFTVFCNNSDYI